MDAASLLLGLLVGALLATAVTLGVVALRGRAGPAPDALEPVHESLDHLHRLLAGIERDRATAHGELREQVGTIGQTSALLRQETAALIIADRLDAHAGSPGEPADRVRFFRLIPYHGTEVISHSSVLGQA